MTPDTLRRGGSTASLGVVTASVVLVLATSGGAGCATAPHEPDPAYVQEIEAWRQARLERLRSETGWLTLVALAWLEPGENRFGSGPDNEIELPEGAAPAYAGSFFLEDGVVRVRAAEDATLLLNGQPVREAVLRSDAEGEPDVLRLGRLYLYVIQRGDRLAVRVKDPESPVRKEFRGLDYFSLDPTYRVEATFVPYDPPKEAKIPTVVGTVETMQVPGRLEFTLRGRRLSLEPLLERPDAEQFFVIFKDETSGRETYGAGRYLYTDLPVNGRVILDFNKAYNPPCVFTPYATCPIPPKENWLPVRIEAGEKVYGEH